MKTYGSQKGQALIITVGVLALMLIVAVTFASSMLMQRREAANFLISIKAGYIAESGINKAIADIRSRITLDTYTVLKSYVSNYVSVLGTDVPFGGGIYDLAITYEEDKVNINTFDEEDDSQVAVLYNGGAGLPYQQIANIIDYRDYDTTAVTVSGSTGIENGTCKNQPYNSTEEVKAAFVSAGATQAQANTWYNLIKNSITINKPIIRGGLLGKYYSNITGASPNVQIDKTSFKGEVIELGYIYMYPGDSPQLIPGADGQSNGYVETHAAEFAGSHLVDSLGDFGLESFAVVWEGYLDILSSDVGTPIQFWVRVSDGVRLFIDNSPNLMSAAAWQDQPETNYGTVYGSSPYTFTTPGWHKIRIEYYGQTGSQTIMLRWKGTGWEWPSIGIKPEEFGYEPPTESGGYNHAGNYKINCTAQVLQDTTVLAEKKVSSEIKVFGVWTQTTKEEFYAAWFNLYNNWQDGEVSNVTWLDSCPTDTDYWDAGASKMHWEVAPATIPNSVKLGFWDNFDEDPAYSAVMMRGNRYISAGSPPWWQGALNVSYNDISDVEGDGDQELGIETNIFEVKYFELNKNYYYPTYSPTYAFTRALTKEVTGTVNVQGTPTNFIGPPSQRMAWRGSGAVSVNRKTAGDGRYYEDTDNNDIWNWIDSDSDGSWDPGEGESQVFPAYDTANPANQVYVHQVSPPGADSGLLDPNQEFNPNNPPAVYSYWQPEPPFCTAWLYPKAEAYDDAGRGYFTLLRDRDGFLYTGSDQSEMNVYSAYFWNFPYSAEKVIAATGWDNVATGAGVYSAFVNGQSGASTTPPPSGYPSADRIFRFKTMNRYDKWAEGAFESSNHLIRGIGASTKQYITWDNIRAMQKEGWLISTPFNTGSNVRWGRVTFTAQTPTNTSIKVYLRKRPTYAHLSIPGGWSSLLTDGASIGGTDPWLQYKVELGSSSFDEASYTNSSRTPVFEDVTFTYIPTVEIFSWKDEP